MKDTLNELKSKINNISKINIDVVKDEIETFILTSIKNKIKQESYIKELK